MLLMLLLMLLLLFTGFNENLSLCNGHALLKQHVVDAAAGLVTQLS